MERWNWHELTAECQQQKTTNANRSRTGRGKKDKSDFLYLREWKCVWDEGTSSNPLPHPTHEPKPSSFQSTFFLLGLNKFYNDWFPKHTLCVTSTHCCLMKHETSGWLRARWRSVCFAFVLSDVAQSLPRLYQMKVYHIVLNVLSKHHSLKVF